ncbi:type I pullulanase [Fulvivirgaceae bacterium BMA12]|uniref:Type I pullulanase n=1 Tax=Agaribacillus aureus TaxID=3051825 RepID=A0ABT8L0F1_9BACT|nr:type I pullulanase [Fulvivirgaceae bacterium BMA12]
MMSTPSSGNPKIKRFSYKQYPVYEGMDLGVTYSQNQTVFKLWSPAANQVKVNIYGQDESQEPELIKKLLKKNDGVWELVLKGDFLNKYYTFQISWDGQWFAEVPDPYATAVGTNGKKGMIVHLPSTDPEGWKSDQGPQVQSATDAIIYELHIRDLSVHVNAGIDNKGKFLGLCELGTQSHDGESTGLSHLKELGITHVHLLPCFDFDAIDESFPESNQFNWGYSPQNYNTPEGSYATVPGDGNIRIKEFKQLVKTLHDHGIGVIMDVVYNHTGDTKNASFNLLTPGYFYRQDEAGGFSNATACGNETASERPMMRKFMLDSVQYWAREYHIDGFRFDLMGVHDIETMNLISRALKKINPGIIIYGEGWTANDSPFPESLRALKHNTHLLNEIASFNDDLRDAVKGHWSRHTAKGFVSGKKGFEESIRFGIVASTYHPQVNYKKVNYSKTPWAKEPTQCINYVSCHDNHTLYDKLKISNPGATEEALIKMHLLSNTIVFTSQGIAFMHAGVEMLRTKGGIENSFNSPDAVNAINWEWKSKNKVVYNYYCQLIQLRKNHPAFRMPNNHMIQKHLKFFNIRENNLIGYEITGNANGDSWGHILLFFNGNNQAKHINIDTGNYTRVIADHQINEQGLGDIQGGRIVIGGRSALLLVKY